jgi:hypothetical protein
MWKDLNSSRYRGKAYTSIHRLNPKISTMNVSGFIELPGLTLRRSFNNGSERVDTSPAAGT